MTQNMYAGCFVEVQADGRYAIMWPDCTICMGDYEYWQEASDDLKDLKEQDQKALEGADNG